MKRTLIVGAILLVIVAGVAAWFLLQNRSVADFVDDGVDYSITAVPPQSDIYLGIDLLSFTDPDVRAVGDLFVAQGDEAFGQLEADYGVQFPQDFVGWVGESASFVVLDVQRDPFTAEIGGDWVLIMESRNARNGRSFVETVTTHWQENGRSVEELQNETEQSLFVSPTADGTRTQAIAATERLVLLGTASAVRQAVDTISNPSLADDATFMTLRERAGAERPFIFALQTAKLAEIGLDAALEQSPIALPDIPLDGYGLTVGTITPTANQLQIEAFTQLDRGRFTAVQQQLLDTTAEDGETAVHVPDDALVYVNGSGTHLLWSLYGEAVAADAGVDNPLLPLIEQASGLLGVDLEADLIALLDGNTAVALFPGDGAAVPALAEAQLDGAVLIQSSQPKEIAKSLEQLHLSLTEGLIPAGRIVQTPTADNQAIFSTSILLFPDLTLNYATTRTDFAFGTTAVSLDKLIYDQVPSLAKRSDYQTLQAQFQPEMTQGLFVDVDALAAHLAAQDMLTPEQAAVLEQVDAGGTAVLIEDDVQKTTLIFLLNQ